MKKLIATLVLAVPVLAGCNLTGPPPTPWDGQPWTVTHPEPCRKYEPITEKWARQHPKSTCLKGTPWEGR